ncbi:hypothetical protein CRG98_045020 [Punica granatum]|uniref:Uncharacterized protein n=1 Tax=Punica granatum TaxID=22663 RepID=A0A2I0HS97_PUNGR|nr:hypothetical protein CRG98_045020 [Punica granatum]
MQASKILCISSLFTNPTSKLVCFSLIIVPTFLITKSFRPKLIGLTQSRINTNACSQLIDAYYRRPLLTCKGSRSSRPLYAPEFNLVGARMREAYATRLGSVYLPKDARQARVRRSRHLLFTTRKSRAVELLGSRSTGYT